MEIKVGTRGSKLALAQTKWVISKLQQNNPDILCSIHVIQTKGDKIQNKPLDKIGDKGLFVKEIEDQLLAGKIDLAVHSMKDMPSSVTKRLVFTPTLPREDRRDVLVLKQNISSLSDLKKGAILATGSKRRQYQLQNLRPDLVFVPIRGNIDTRLRKLDTENLDGIVLAAAGLKRLGLEERISYYLSSKEVVPAPAQGALGVQIRQQDNYLYDRLKKIASEKDSLEVEVERIFLQTVEGSCSIPVGASATIEKNRLICDYLLGEENSTRFIKKQLEQNFDTLSSLQECAKDMARRIVKEFQSW